jgi:hypothetical protein
MAMTAFCLPLIVAGCATTVMEPVKPTSSGFLGKDYALLTPGETAKGQAGLRYFNPAAQWEWGDVQNAMDLFSRRMARSISALTTGAATPADLPLPD